MRSPLSLQMPFSHLHFCARVVLVKGLNPFGYRYLKRVVHARKESSSAIWRVHARQPRSKTIFCYYFTLYT